MSTKPPQVDLYEDITNRIITALEAGTVPWHKPWAVAGGMPRNLVSKRHYSGINVLLLAMADQAGQPYSSPYWVTYKQAAELGGHVRKDEKATMITFTKSLSGPKPDDDREPGEISDRDLRPRRMLKRYWVFNTAQCDELESKIPEDAALPVHQWERMETCERIIKSMPKAPRIQHGRNHAFYVPALDYVGMPDMGAFATAAEYYSTLFHELVHSTGHPNRLTRCEEMAVQRFGSKNYSIEELVAEIGNNYLAGFAGILPAIADNSAAYIAGWLKKLQDDRKILMRAATNARKAAEFILNPLQEDDGAE